MKIAITGATGYIGLRVIHAALLSGHDILALSRSNPYLPGVSWQFFDLNDSEKLSLPIDVDVIVHLAAFTQNAEGSEYIEVAAAKHLILKGCEIGARLIFVSSQTAQMNAPTGYGRIKWQIENLFLAAKGWVVRPGLVYGGIENGLYGRLCNIVKRLPLIPSFAPALSVQLIHVDDLAKALLTCSQLVPPSVMCVAENDVTSFSHFLRVISLMRYGRWKIPLTIPTLFIRVFINFLPVSFLGRLGLDRFKSLLYLPRMSTTLDLQALSLRLRPLNVGITRSGSNRRALLSEGRIFSHYILRSTPRTSLLKLYVKAMETLRGGTIMHLPTLIKFNPAFLALFETAGGVDEKFRNELGWRLNVALVLAEASPYAVSRFLGPVNQHLGLVKSYLSMAITVVLEIMRRLVQILLAPLLTRMGTHRVFE